MPWVLRTPCISQWQNEKSSALLKFLLYPVEENTVKEIEGANLAMFMPALLLGKNASGNAPCPHQCLLVFLYLLNGEGTILFTGFIFSFISFPLFNCFIQFISTGAAEVLTFRHR